MYLIIYCYCNKLCCIFLVMRRIHEHLENNLLVTMEAICTGVV